MGDIGCLRSERYKFQFVGLIEKYNRRCFRQINVHCLHRLLPFPESIADITLMTAILPMGIPVGSKLFSAAFTGEAVDGPGPLPDFISVLIPPFPAAGVVAEVTLPASLWLFQKSAAVPAHTARFLHHLQVGFDCFFVSVDVILLAEVPDIVTAQVELLCDLSIPDPLRPELPDLLFLQYSYHVFSFLP